MELYGLKPVRDVSQSAQKAEWGSTGPETVLEDPLWKLSMRGTELYPERHGMPDCVYYMRTGFCGYGSRCRYNHPRDRAAEILLRGKGLAANSRFTRIFNVYGVEAAVRATGEYPERPGEPACQFYLKTGTCKFGASCKFHHPKHGGGSFSHVQLNIYGYPSRLGEKECSYYLKTGQCKFGITCKFHHPQPGISLPATAPQFYHPVQSPSVPLPEQYGGVSSSLRVARPPLVPGSYIQGAYGPMLFSPGALPIHGYYSAPVSPVLSPGAQPTVGSTSVYSLTQLHSSTPSLARPYPSLPSSTGPARSVQKERTFPERPGEPECQFYMKTGDCKFGLSCRYHHPRDWVVQRTNCVLSPMGFPLRPGIQACSFYLQNGRCKFGPQCKFDHPMRTMRYTPSASSLIDMAVGPYPVGSLLATIVPSPSSGLQPDLISSSKKDSYLGRIPPPGTTSSNSVGLIYSQTASAPLSDLQFSGQSSVSLSSSRSARQGGEVHLSS